MLRPVAVASPGALPARASLGALPLFGGPAALGRALHASGAHAVLLVARDGADGPLRSALRHHLETEGGVDVWALEVTVRKAEA
jgi:anti-sigma factor RsiW